MQHIHPFSPSLLTFPYRVSRKAPPLAAPHNTSSTGCCPHRFFFAYVAQSLHCIWLLPTNPLSCPGIWCFHRRDGGGHRQMPDVPLQWLCPYSWSWWTYWSKDVLRRCVALTSAFPAQVIESASLALNGENKAQSHSPKRNMKQIKKLMP